MKKLKFVASMLALGLGIACGNAQALITIDNFNTGVTVTDIGGGGSTSATDPPGVDRSLCQLCVFRAIENDQGVSLVSNDTPITVLST